MFIDYQWDTDTATPYACWEDMGAPINGADELDETYRKNLYIGIDKLFSLDNVIYSTTQGSGTPITKVRSLMLYKNWKSDFSHGRLSVITELRVCPYKRQLVTREYTVNPYSEKNATMRSVIRACERNYMIDSILQEIG